MLGFPNARSLRLFASIAAERQGPYIAGNTGQINGRPGTRRPHHPTTPQCGNGMAFGSFVLRMDGPRSAIDDE